MQKIRKTIQALVGVLCCTATIVFGMDENTTATVKPQALHETKQLSSHDTEDWEIIATRQPLSQCSIPELVSQLKTKHLQQQVVEQIADALAKRYDEMRIQFEKAYADLIAEEIRVAKEFEILANQQSKPLHTTESDSYSAKNIALQGVWVPVPFFPFNRIRNSKQGLNFK
jgi:hypothetical protein